MDEITNFRGDQRRATPSVRDEAEVSRLMGVVGDRVRKRAS